MKFFKIKLNITFKYLYFVIFSIHNQLKHKKHLLIRILIYSLIILIYFNIFRKVTNNSNRLWHIAITQWIIGSNSIVLFYIKNDIATNRIIYYSLKPTSYIFYRFFDALGESLLKIFFIGFFCISQVYILTKNFPFNLFTFSFGFIGILAGTLLFNSILMFLGLLSYWIKSINNLIFLNLTCIFCFGGLIMPLNFYPEFFRKIAFFTPYPWILNWPANLITNNSSNFGYEFICWFLWISFFMFLNLLTYKKIQNSNK